eukprot:802254-Prorocentrum_minimum.AAC.2
MYSGVAPPCVCRLTSSSGCVMSCCSTSSCPSCAAMYSGENPVWGARNRGAIGGQEGVRRGSGVGQEWVRSGSEAAM